MANFGTFRGDGLPVPGTLTLFVDPNSKLGKTALERRQSFADAISSVVLKTPARFYNLTSQDVEAGEKDAIDKSFLSVTLRTPVTIWVSLAIFYSFVPIVAFLGLFVWLLVSEGLFPFYGTMLMITGSLISEFLLKNIVREPRPPESSVESYGMPSTHCINSLALMIWLVANMLTPTQVNIIGAVVIIFLLAPVGWGRYYLGDHTLKQCAVGSAGGVVFGILAFILQTSVFGIV